MKNLKNVMQILFLSVSLILYGGCITAANVPTDTDISNAVESELMNNATIPSYLIDVTTNEGIVSLTGTVNNILEKDRAVKIARTVKGVRAVINNIVVNAPLLGDDILKQNVNDALLRDPATDSYEIMVDVNNGSVTLSGTVESWQKKQLSEFVVKGVLGVKEIKNEISVNNIINRPDLEIQNEIQKSLKNDVRIDNALVDVEVKNSKVLLSGIVGSASEKSLAYSQAWTSGVKSVSFNELEVKEWARNKNLRKDKYLEKTDIEILNAVKDAFRHDPRVNSFNIDVSVLSGNITLTGKVDNLKAKRAAEQDANNVVGVMRVKNYLKVRPVFIPNDKVLEANVNSSFKHNPIVQKWEIDVTATNGVIYLNGSVDSYYEKATIEDLASKTKGVIAVENNIILYDNNDSYYYDYYDWNNYYPPYHIDVVYSFGSDARLKRNIIDEMWWSPYVNEDQIAITITNGKVVLTGTVDTEREKMFAEINAFEGGASEVENNLVVNY